jgi:hypothetical protein
MMLSTKIRMILLAMAGLGPAAAADTLLSVAMEAEIDRYQPAAAAAVIAEHLIDGPSSAAGQARSVDRRLPGCCCLCPNF